MGDIIDQMNQSSRDAEARRHNRDQRIHNLKMQNIESEKVRAQSEFNNMYKLRLENLEKDSSSNNWKFIVSTILSLGAVAISIIALVTQ